MQKLDAWNVVKWLFNILILVLTIYILTLLVNLTFALGYVMMLVIHEMGHVMAAKGYGATVRFGGFTPFGAYIQIENETSIKENAVIAISGPLCGLVTTIIYYFLFYLLRNYTFLWLSFFTGVVSVLNLLPLNPFDGGKVISGTFLHFPLIFVPVLGYGIFKTYEHQMMFALLFAFLIIYIVVDVIRMKKQNRIELLLQFDTSGKVLIFIAYVLIVLMLAGLLAAMAFDYKEALLPQLQPIKLLDDIINIIKQWLS